MPLAVYCASLVGVPSYWDTGEAQTVPWIFGIMHPTGFPAFTIFAGVFAHVVPFGSVAWRIALFSALAMSASCWLVFRLAREFDGDAWMACAAAFLFGFGAVAWTRGTRAEVHTLALVFALAALYCAFVWMRTGNARTMIWGALWFGLGLATHPLVALIAPALLLFLTERLDAVRWRTFLLATLTVLAALSLYAYLPLRSAAVTAARLDPTRSLGLPPGRAFWDNNHPSSPHGLMRELNGSEYGAGGTFARMTRLSTYAESFPKYAQAFFEELTPIGIMLAFTGLLVLFQRKDASALILIVAFAVPTAFSLAYTIEADPKRYQLEGFAIVAVLAGVGATWLMQALLATPLARAVTAAAIAALFIGVNHVTFDQRRVYGAQAVIDSVVQNTPDDAILVAPWIYATPLAYASYVEHRLGRRIVDSAWLSQDAAYVPKWVHRRRVYVVGQIFGEVRGFRAVKISDDPVLYRIMRSPVRRRLSSQ